MSKTKPNGKSKTIEDMKQEAIKEASGPSPEQVRAQLEIEHSRTVRAIYQIEHQLQEHRAKERALVERINILQIQQAGQK